MSEPDPALLQNAVDDREAHPWRYYKLDHETMKRICERQAQEAASLRQRLEKAEAHGALAVKNLVDADDAASKLVDENETLKAQLAQAQQELRQWQEDKPLVRTALLGNIDRADKAEASLAELQKQVDALKHGDCWCEVGIGNPMMRGEHSKVCLALQRRRSPSEESTR